KVYVKVNATEDHRESEYSEPVDYTYTPSAEVEAEDYAKLVEAIGSITADSTDTDAKAVAAAISTANNKYNGLSAEAKALDEVIAAKAEFDTKKAAYEGVYNPAKAAYDTFAAALEEAVVVATEEEDAADLNAKVTAVNTANGALNTLAQSMVTAAQTTSYNTVKDTLTSWNTAIDAAKGIWADVTAASFNAIEGTDAQKLTKAEQNITAANALIAQYSDKKYVQNAVVEGTTKISDKKAIADNALTSAKTAIETIVGTLKTTVNAFTGTIASDNVNDEYLAELNGLKTLVDGFGTYASTLWTTELTGKLTDEIEALETAIAKANAIAAAVEEIDAAYEALTEDDEEIIAAVNSFASGTYANYADYIKADAGVSAAYGNLTAARTTAQNNIKTRLNAIKTLVETVLANLDNNEIRDNYNALEEQRNAIVAETGAYASEYLSTLKIGEYELIQAVDNAINKMLTTVVSSEGGEAYSLTGVTLKITLFKTFRNFRDEKITVTGDLAPKLTVSGNTVTVEQNFELNDINEYVAIISIENIDIMGDDASYTVGTETTTLKFGTTIGNNPFFTNVNEIEGEDDGFKKAIVDGNFNMTFQNGCTAEHYYLEVYNADAITVDGAFVKFTEMPLGKIEVDGESVAMTRDELNRFLLNSNLSSLFLDKTLTVRFMIYGTTVTNGVPAFTAMNHSVISEAINFSLTAEDAKTAISTFNNTVFDLGVYDSGVLSLISSGNIKYGEENEENVYVPAFLDQFDKKDTITADNIENYLRIKISAYKESDDSLLFSTTTLFKNQAYNYHTFIREWARDRINKGIASETVNFYLTLSIVPIENTDLAQVFRESEKVNVNIQGPYTGTHTFKEGDDKTSVNLPNALVSTDISNEGVFTLITEAIISDEFAAQFENTDITKDNVKDYLQIRISAYAADDTEGENELFYAIAPFRAGGYNYNTFIKDWTVNRYPDGVQSETVEFYFIYTVQLKEEVNNAANPLLSDFKDSERIIVDQPSGIYTGTYTFDYVEITLHNIIDAGVWNGGNFSLITAYNEGIADVVNNYDNFTGQFNNVIDGLTVTKDNIKDYLQIKVTAYAATDTENANELFSAIAPFENQGYNYHAFIKSWSVYHYQNAASKNETVNFKLTLTVQLKEEVNGEANPFSKYFKYSVSTPVRQENDFNGSYEFKESDVKLPDTNQLNKTNEPILFQGFDVANDIINGYISHMEIHFAKVENATDPVNPSTYETAYVYYYKNNNGDDTFVVYKNADKSDEGLVFNKGGNEYWRGLTDVNNWFKSYDPDFDITGEGWYFRTRLIDNTEDDRYIVGEGVSGWTTFYTPAD
ncbi:MAG: hypothetical protein K2L12_08170, partial [Clostridia bacterium]|nr:hypothetical protein [Clostridia bacterium]